ncbi:MAG TPA: hypothetical protein PLU37_07855 [Chitinophagaceae bacterium]|nr:hypothetical protein [Chitinophagaceae bacterium]
MEGKFKTAATGSSGVAGTELFSFLQARKTNKAKQNSINDFFEWKDGMAGANWLGYRLTCKKMV